MYLPPTLALILFDLGFPIKKLAAGNVYGRGRYHEWIVGGQYEPEVHSIIPQKVVDKGTLLPTTVDLLLWLEEATDSLIINHKIEEDGYSKVYINVVIKGTYISIIEPHVLLFALFEMAIKVLLCKKKRVFNDKSVKRLKRSYKVG